MGKTATKNRKRTAKTPKPAAVLAAVSVNDNDETGWRKITGASTRNLTPLKQERMYEIAFYLWENNPLARWIIEILKDFILAEGLPFQADNDAVSEALNDFWYDPLNQMDVYLEKHVREQWLFGVLCLPVYTAEQTGKVRLGYIDPAMIDEVITDPGNVKMIIGVTLKGTSGQKGKKLKTILPTDADTILTAEAQALRETFVDGECFYSAVNNTTNSPMGRSELLVTADWLDAYEQFLFDYADRWPLLNSFVWDILVKNGDDAGIRKQVNSFVKKPGGAFGHNESVEVKAVSPNLQSYDASAGAKLLKNHILSAHGYPSFWYGGAEGEASMALGVEMGTPAYKMLSSKQRAFKYSLEAVLSYVIAARRAAGYLKVSDEDANAWSVVLPELTTKDVVKNSTAISQVATALGTAIMQKMIDTETARDVFLFLLATLGIEVDAQEVTKRLEAEAKKAEEQDYATKPAPVLPAEPVAKAAKSKKPRRR